MAFLKDDEDSNKTQGLNSPNGNPNDQQQAPTGQVQLSSAPTTSDSDANSNIATPQAAQANQAPVANPKASSGTFTNIRQYIDANKGNRIASATSQRLQTATNQANRGISDAQKQFNQRVETGTLANRENALSDIRNAITQAKNVTAQPLPTPQPTALSQPQAQPESQANPQPAAPVAPQYNDQQTAQRFQDIINARYQGPVSLRDAGLFEKASGKVSNAQALLNKTQNAQNRASLLRDVFAQNRDYSRGQQGLDALLLNTNKQGVQNIVQQGKQAGDIQKALENADVTASNLATNRASEISNIQNQARDVFTGEQKGFNQAVESRMDDLIKNPALDANGKPIVKLDATGKPMVDANGQPVYQTKWDQLPEYFRDVIRNKEANNKALIDQNVKAITEKEINPIVNSQEYKDSLKAKNNLDSLQKEIEARKSAVSVAESFTRFMPTYGGELYLAQQRLEDAQNKYNEALTILQPQLEKFNQFQNQIASSNSKIAQEKQRNLNQLNLSQAELDVLGIGQGQGLYNLNADAIKQANAERDRLVTRDEQARMFALAQLAGLDASKRLNTDVLYNDLSKAGTQTLNSSLDRAATQAQILEAEKNFQDLANQMNLTGYGMKKHKQTGNKYYADASANLGDVLKRSGYKVDANTPAKTLKDINTIATQNTPYTDPQGLTDRLEEAATSNFTDNTSVADKLANLGLGGLGVVGNLFGVNPINSISSVLGGGRISSAYAKNDAKAFAQQDLNNKITQALKNAGFENRVVASDNDQTRARTEALKELLRRQG